MFLLFFFLQIIHLPWSKEPHKLKTGSASVVCLLTKQLICSNWHLLVSFLWGQTICWKSVWSCIWDIVSISDKHCSVVVVTLKRDLDWQVSLQSNFSEQPPKGTCARSSTSVLNNWSALTLEDEQWRWVLRCRHRWVLIYILIDVFPSSLSFIKKGETCMLPVFQDCIVIL